MKATDNRPTTQEVYRKMVEGGLSTSVQNAIQDLKLQFKNRVEELINSLLTPLFTVADFDEFCIFAYTPAFNDGDPCLHQHNAFNPTYEEEGYREYYGDAVDEDMWGIDREPFYLAFQLSEWKDLLHMTYGTNWRLIFKWDGSKVITTREDFDYGY